MVEQGQPPAWVEDYPLWLGWFPRKYVAGMSPLMPHGWSAWTFWQYSGKGRISGVQGDVDLDLFNGTVEELLAFAGKNAPTTVPVTHVVAAGETLPLHCRQVSGLSFGTGRRQSSVAACWRQAVYPWADRRTDPLESDLHREGRRYLVRHCQQARNDHCGSGGQESTSPILT